MLWAISSSEHSRGKKKSTEGERDTGVDARITEQGLSCKEVAHGQTEALTCKCARPENHTWGQPTHIPQGSLTDRMLTMHTLHPQKPPPETTMTLSYGPAKWSNSITRQASDPQLL